MLINFSIENWQSFRDKATLSLLAGREKQHAERVAKIAKYKLGLLPIAGIYGANASGKTKLFNALKFAQNFIVKVVQPEANIPREYFKLDQQYAAQPSCFKFDLFLDNACYEFSFSVMEKKVIEEKLVKIFTHSEQILYFRKVGQKIQFHESLKLDKEQLLRLQFVAEGTSDNQLFLNNSVNQKLQHFQVVYDWFRYHLVLVSPDSLSLISMDPSSATSILLKLDVGISRLDKKITPIKNMELPEGLKNIIENLPEGGQCIIPAEEQLIIVRRNGELFLQKLVPYHKSAEGNDIAFDMRDESAGTLRIIDLLPIFWDLLGHSGSKTYFIDELDRCLHTLMTRNFLEAYLRSCSAETRSQLIFTTHDVLLMDQNLLRRDEIWVTEKNQNACSTLYSFADFKEIRSDRDIRKSYLQGRLGGIPKTLLWERDDDVE